MNTVDQVTIINGRRGGGFDYLRKVWKYRFIAVAVARRDLKIRYSQALLGFVWAVIQPLTGLVIFTVFFERLIKIKAPDMPYPLFAFSGMAPWFFFSHIVHNAGVSLVESRDLIRKVYFPRILLPIAKALVGLVELGVSLILLIALMLLLRRSTNWSIVLLPLFALLNIGVGLSVAIWLSALTIRYRDFHHIIPYLVSFGIWLTPVFYPVTLIPPRLEWLAYWNPMAATIAGFRWSLGGGAALDGRYLVSFLPTAGLLVSGFTYFRRIENEIADHI
jgi:lipopolysaccharide transport system permease protein